nr:NAD-binding protein [Chloroflexota bacterium]
MKETERSSGAAEPDEPASSSADRHVVICGIEHLGERTVEELLLGDETVVAITPAPDPEFERRHDAVRVVVGDFRHEATLRAAGVPMASSVVLTSSDDLANLHAALAVGALNPRARIVIRLFDDELGRHIERILPNAIALSSSAISAPAYVAAALDGEAGALFAMGGKTLLTHHTSTERGARGPARLVIPIARISPDRAAEPLPDADPADPGLIVVEVLDHAPPGHAASRGRAAPRSGRLAGLPREVRARLASPDRRLVRFAGTMLLVAAGSAVFFALAAGLTPLDAFGYAVTLLTGATSAFGIDARQASGLLKVYTIVLSLIGAAVVAIVYALITDAIIRSRLLQTLGARAVPKTIRDHVIVCGLGSIGYRVALGIKARGVPIVVIERDDDARFATAARVAGIPVVTGDARLPAVLEDIGIRSARAIVAVTTDDLANLTAVLNARAMRPDLRCVVRVFDPDFATRVRDGFGIRFTRSVTHLAAPAFAAATIGSEIAASVPVGDRRVVLFARLTIAQGSRAEGVLASSMTATGRRRLLAIEDPDGTVRWQPPADEVLDAGESVLVVAT